MKSRLGAGGESELVVGRRQWELMIDGWGINDAVPDSEAVNCMLGWWYSYCTGLHWSVNTPRIE